MPLPLLNPGDSVRIMAEPTKPGWAQPGTVVEKCHDRSYLVSTPTGTFRRNRVHLKKVKPGVNNIPIQKSVDLDPDLTSDTETAQPQSAESEPQLSQPQIQTRAGRTVVRPSKFDDYVTWI